MVKKIILITAAASWLAGQFVAVFYREEFAAVAALLGISLCLLVVAVLCDVVRPARFLPRNMPAPYSALALLMCVYAVINAGAAPKLSFFFFLASAVILLLLKKNTRPLFDSPLSAGGENKKFMLWEAVFLVIILGLAVYTRAVDLTDIPAGAVEHEGRMAILSGTVVSLPNYVPYITDSHANWSSMVFYQGGFLAKIFGWEAGNFRLPSAIWGILSIFALYFLIRRITSAGTAAVITLLYTGSALHIGMSRQFFTASVLFLPVVLGFFLLLEGIRKNKWFYFVVAGMAAGLSLHGYFPGRTVPVIFGVWLVWMMVVPRNNRISMRNFLIFWAGFLIVSWPVIQFAIQNPKAFSSYIDAMNAPYKQGIIKAAQSALFYVNSALPAQLNLYFTGAEWDYNFHIAYEPLLDKMIAMLFACGFFISLFVALKPVPLFMLLFLFGALAPALLAGPWQLTRRSIMALPAIYIFGAFALEYFLRTINYRNSKKAGVFLLAAAFCAASFISYKTVSHYFNVFAKNPGTRLSYAYHMYLAGKEMEKYPGADVLMSLQVETVQTSAMMLIKPEREYIRSVTCYDIFNHAGDNDRLLLLSAYLEPALPIIKMVYPGAVVKVFREEAVNDPFYTDRKFAMDARTKNADIYNNKVYLVSVFVPAEEVKKSRYFYNKIFKGAAEERIDVFTDEFGRKYRGKNLKLSAAFILYPGENSVVFSNKWQGWKLNIDGKPRQWGEKIKICEGAHYFEISGNVPAGASGKMPLSIYSGDTDLAEKNSIICASRPFGLKAGYISGKQAWNKKFDIVRNEVFPVKRFYGLTPELKGHVTQDYSVVLSGKLKVPEKGSYTFLLREHTRGRLFINGKEVFSNYVHPHASEYMAKPVKLKKGEKVDFKAYYEAGYGVVGWYTFFPLYMKGPEQEAEFIPGGWFYPY